MDLPVRLDSSAQAQRVLVLGGKSGMLGQALVKRGKSLGYEMHTLGREDGDILDMDFLEKQYVRINPHIIFNTVAYTAVDLAEEESPKAFLVNKSFAENVARLIRNTSTYCIHYSTDFVFDGKQHSAYTEEDSTNPLCVYGASKLAGEHGFLGIDNAAVFRTAWLFGCGRKNFVSTISKLAKEKPILQVVHDQVGSPTCTFDLAEMSFLAAQKRVCGLYHAVNSGSGSWCDLASEAVSLLNLSTFVEPITTEQWPQKATRPKYSVLSNKKLSQALNYEPRPWVQALREYLFECMDDFNS